MSISQTSSAGSPLRIQTAITRPIPPAPRSASERMRAEPRRDEQPAHLGLAEAELVVGRERLRSVDQARDRDLVHRRNSPPRVGGDLLKARPVLFEQPTIEVCGNRVEQVPVDRPPGGAALRAA